MEHNYTTPCSHNCVHDYEDDSDLEELTALFNDIPVITTPLADLIEREET